MNKVGRLQSFEGSKSSSSSFEFEFELARTRTRNSNSTWLETQSFQSYDWGPQNLQEARQMERGRVTRHEYDVGLLRLKRIAIGE